MLATASADFAAIPGVEVVTLLGAGLPGEYTLDPRVEVRRVEPGAEAEAFRRAAGKSDYALVIAPELDGILVERCRWAAAARATLLGPSAEAVELTSNKFALAEHWQAAGVPTPPTIVGEPTFPPPWVIKPRYGAGSHGIRVWEGEAPAEPIGPFDIIQPLVSGDPASVSFLVGPRETQALRPCAQILDENFKYLGGSTPLAPELAHRATAIARQAIDCVPGLFGYFGVDVVLGERDVALEINPRFTTSYIGLRKLADGNLAEWLLRIVRGEPAALRWSDTRVEFQV